MLYRITPKHVIATLILASAALAPLASAADSTILDPKVGKRIIITGCLHAGEHSGQFVLVGVTEKTEAGMAPVPYAIYMLDSSRDMKPLVGALVDVNGIVLKRDSKVGTIKVQVAGDEESSSTVKVEGSDEKSATTKVFAGTTSSGVESIVEVSRPVYRVTVDSVTASAYQASGPACK